MYQILGAEAWEDMHSSPTTKKLFDAFNTSFTRGGVNIIRYFYPVLERIDEYHTWSSPTTKKLVDALNTSFTRGGVNIIRYSLPYP